MARDPDRKKKRRDEDDDREEKPVNVEEELQELEGAWDEAEDKGDSFGDIPDDRYQAKVTGARIGKSKSSQRIQIAWEFTIISGEYKNRKKWAYDGLETKENLDYVKTRLARLKVKIPKKITDLAEALEACIGLTCEIQVKTRGDFQNVYVNKLIDVDSDEVQDADDWKPSKRSRNDDDDDRPKRREEAEDDRGDDEPPKKKSKTSDDDDDDDDDRKERSKRRDDDDDDAPRKRSRDDDDDDDKPRKRRDDDDDDRPRKSKF